jgi:AraC-like DNA-binding protein
VPTPRSSPLHSVPSASGGISRMVCARLQAAGLEPEPLLSAAGLTTTQIEDRLRIDVAAQIRLLNLAADALHDPVLGFHLAREFDPREIGLMHYVIASSSTLAEALIRAGRYCRVVNEGLAIAFKAESATVALACPGVERQLDRHQIEFLAFGLVRACRVQTATRIAPLKVRLMHRRDVTPEEFRQFLGCDVEFGANHDEIILPKATAALPLVNADTHLNKLLTAYAEEALAHRKRHAGHIRSEVERAVAPLLPHGKASSSEVARELGMSPRTLVRLLSADGLTFSSILQQFRLDLAKAYLSHGDLSISQIAWLLGYREVSTFTHAFKRWTGKTPREMRAARC